MGGTFWMAAFAFVAGAVATYLSWRSSRQVGDLVPKIDALASQVEAVHKATDGLTDRLVKTTAIAEHALGRAAGLAAGVAEEKARQQSPPVGASGGGA